MLGKGHLIARFQSSPGRIGACLGSIILTAGALAAMAQEATSLLEIVRREAPLGWERIIAQRQTLHFVVMGADKEGKSSTCTVFVRGAFRLHIMEEQADNRQQAAAGKPDAIRVLGVNDRYAFELEAPHRNGPYRLVQISWLAKDQPLNPLDWRVLDVLNRHAIYRPIMIACLPLHELVKYPSFRWLSAEETWENGIRLIRCQCQWDPKEELGKGCYLGMDGPCIIELDPANDYRLRRFEGTGPYQGQRYRMTQECRYEGAHLVERSFKSVRVSDGMVVGELKSKYIVYDSAPDPDRFYLTAFGLPEPPQPKRHGGLPWVWLVMGVVAVTMAAALILWSRSSRRASS